MSDIPGSTATTVSLTIGGSLTSSIETAGDHDWVRVTLVAGQTYRFSLGGGTLGDAYLRLRNAAGTEIAADDDSGPGLDSLLTFTATTGGTYYLDASGFSDSYTGTYTLAASTEPSTPVFTNDQISTYLTDGFWTYFGGSAHRWGTNTITYNVTALTAEGQALARAAFQTWSSVANLTFVETAGAGMIQFDDNQSGAFANASYSNGITTSANINVSTAWLTSYGVGLRSYSFQTYIHEIGHVLGLGHGGPYNGSASYGTDNSYLNDSWQATVMSYFDQDQNTYVNASRSYVVSPQIADILAVQRLYGAANARGGDTTYGFNSNAGTIYDAATFGSDVSAPIDVSYTIHDSGGTDLLDYSGYTRSQIINLTAEAFSDIGGEVGNVSIARGTVIENARGGSGSDIIYGNGAGNHLRGEGGNDTMFGLSGVDYLEGGAGADEARVGGLDGGGFDIIRRGDFVFTLDRANRSYDANTQMERFTHISGVGSMDISAVDVFDVAAYAASYDDLARAFRTNSDAAFNHYLNAGFFERREVDFSGAQYLANHADLRAAFGSNTAAATQHFLTGGVDERRLAEDPLDYIASYTDLILAFRGQSQAGLVNAGLNHYRSGGQAEGRRGGIDFDAGQYLSNFADLRAAFGANDDAAATHFINNGYAEHRLDANPYQYVASYNDLIVAFRSGTPDAIRQAGLNHFRDGGSAEGRRDGVDFSAEQYLANYADLRQAFLLTDGSYDEAAATLHFIRFGFGEGRTDAIL